MPSLYRILAVAALSASLMTATAPVSAAEDKAADDVVATVNGQPITKQVLMVYAQQRGGDHSESIDQQALINEVVTRELLYQKAIANGLDKDPEVAAALENDTHTLLANVVIQDLLQSKQPTDAELKAAYDAHIKTMGKTEYKARHILVKTEDEAKDVIAQLDKGADFAALAKDKSIGPSGKEGGDLGWFSPDNMVKPFSDAAAALKVGDYSKTPVHTQFGWHVIKLEDTRPVSPPSFDDLKGQLLNNWRNKMISAYLDKLRSQADVKVTGMSDPATK
jgi:peptidyl-prolyl cis-trans isomerase C